MSSCIKWVLVCYVGYIINYQRISYGELSQYINKPNLNFHLLS